MNLAEIREFLEECERCGTPMDRRFRFDRPQGELSEQHVDAVIHGRYLPRLAALIARLHPARMLTIGALLGTLESYLLQCCDGASFLKRITICDLDAADYNSRRDNGSLCYRNICGTDYGNFPGIFTFIRGNSAWPDVRKTVRACGPFDLVFVDGEHTETGVYSDLVLSSEVLAEGGTILVHDTDLHESGTPRGWAKWGKDNSADWVTEEVTDEVFYLGMGIVEARSAELGVRN